MTAEDILKVLLDKYHSSNGWLSFPELRDGPGFDKRSIDLFVMHSWPSKRMQRIAFEIKVSVQDFKKELAIPNKREPFVKFANEFYFVTPKGLLDKYRGDIPPECGLAEITLVPYGDTERATVRVIRRAEYHECPPTWGFICTILRRMKPEIISEIADEPAEMRLQL